MRHDHRRTADPGAFADANETACPGLVADGDIQIVDAVSVAAARDVDAGSEQHVPFEVYESELATRTDIDVLIKARTCLTEEAAKLNRGR